MAFVDHSLLPGVTHIEEAPMGVCMTLLEGDREALLVDTGYGLEDTAAHAASLTEKPLRVLLTHGHHDHAMGAVHFPRVWLFPEDAPVYETYTNAHWREHVLEGVRAKGLAVDEAAYLSAPAAPWEAPPASVDLGGLTAEIIRCPGHTPGSAVVWVPERKLLITGDDWNPVTWLFFPEALPVRAWRENVRHLLDLPFERIVCSHRGELWPRETFEAFLDALTDEALQAAEPTGEGAAMGIDTAAVRPTPEQALIFDRAKLA